MKRTFLLVSLLFCFFLVACGSTPKPTPALPNSNPTSSDTAIPTSASSSSSSTLPTVLHITRTDLSATNSMGPLDKTVTDAQGVQKLYNAAQVLPPYATENGISSDCLNDTGVIYHLDFLAGTTVLQHMNLDPGSCMILYLSATNLRQVDQTFLSLFKQTIQVNVLTH